jgi:hypothetical protein
MAKPAVIEARKAQAMEAHAKELAGVKAELATVNEKLDALLAHVLAANPEDQATPEGIPPEDPKEPEEPKEEKPKGRRS